MCPLFIATPPYLRGHAMTNGQVIVDAEERIVGSRTMRHLNGKPLKTTRSHVPQRSFPSRIALGRKDKAPCFANGVLKIIQTHDPNKSQMRLSVKLMALSPESQNQQTGSNGGQVAANERQYSRYSILPSRRWSSHDRN